MGERGVPDIIPECFIDTNLVETLLVAFGRSVKEVNHQHSCTKVVGVIREKFEDKFAIGLIDDDKISPDLGGFEEIGKSGRVRLLKHENKPHYLIIHEVMEKFIISCAEEKGLDLSGYGLESDLERLKSLTKKAGSQKDARFRSLFQDLYDSKDMKIIGNILNYLLGHKYDASIMTLKTFFTVSPSPNPDSTSGKTPI